MRHLRWSFFVKRVNNLLLLSFFAKMLPHRCLTGFWIYIWFLRHHAKSVMAYQKSGTQDPKVGPYGGTLWWDFKVRARWTGFFHESNLLKYHLLCKLCNPQCIWKKSKMIKSWQKNNVFSNDLHKSANLSSFRSCLYEKNHPIQVRCFTWVRSRQNDVFHFVKTSRLYGNAFIPPRWDLTST